MGESDRHHRAERNAYRHRRPLLGATNNALVAAVAINITLFALLFLIQVSFFWGDKDAAFFYTHIGQWFELPADLTKLSERPWTFIVYMFSDTGITAQNIFRIISNMLWLWAFGSLLQQMAGNDKLIPVYIYGGLLGGFFFILANYLVPSLAPLREHSGLLGANAAVLGVAMATTSLNPDFRFFTQIRNGIPVWVLMSVYLLIDFAGIFGYGAAYSFAHLGGALAGFLFVVFLRRGYDGSVWMNKAWHWCMNVFTPAPQPKKDIRGQIFYDTGNTKPFTKTTNVTQKRVDEILDKINQKGYHFLTDEEKAFLKKAADDKAL